MKKIQTPFLFPPKTFFQELLLVGIILVVLGVVGYFLEILSDLPVFKILIVLTFIITLTTLIILYLHTTPPKKQQTLVVKNLPITTIIGAYPSERSTPQTILLTLALTGDFSKPAATDNLADALDYASLHHRITETLNARKPRLIEHAARLVADLCLALDGVNTVSVSLEKPNVPVPSASAVFQLTASK